MLEYGCSFLLVFLANNNALESGYYVFEEHLFLLGQLQ